MCRLVPSVFSLMINRNILENLVIRNPLCIWTLLNLMLCNSTGGHLRHFGIQVVLGSDVQLIFILKYVLFACNVIASRNWQSIDSDYHAWFQSCRMAQCCHLIKAAFPKINDDIYQVKCWLENCVWLKFPSSMSRVSWKPRGMTLSQQMISTKPLER